MSPQQRGGGGGEVARGAGYAAFLGALLIGVAVIIGIVLLQIGDKNDNGPASAVPTKKTTTTTRPDTSTTTHTGSTTHNTPQRSPGQVSLIVLNGGAATGKASAMSTALAGKGYTNHGQPNDWTGHSQKGDTVYCRSGLDREGAALAVAVGSVAGGSSAVLHIPLPVPPPPFSTGRDCVVVVGGK
jgi:hypothetical protein